MKATELVYFVLYKNTVYKNDDSSVGIATSYRLDRSAEYKNDGVMPPFAHTSSWYIAKCRKSRDKPT
jgi:hypothetical protein